MVSCLKPRIEHFKKYDFITMAGDTFKELGIILKGEAIVIKENAAGNRVIMMTLKPSDMFGEMVVFSEKSKWPATVQAQKDCTVFFLSKTKIIGECDKVCPWHKQMIQNMLKITSMRALKLNKQVEYLTIKSMRVKLSTYILEQYNKCLKNTFELPLKRNELADYLNVSRPSMSREMGRMRDEGLIDFYKSTVKIIDIEGLKSFV
ncbi:Crp/Fnr family transcriptional regulator [Clostridium sp. 'deep sea']|nr:Crp/Fnr family transcriptional regulator [Clostridium sp. 'deep sea']